MKKLKYHAMLIISFLFSASIFASFSESLDDLEKVVTSITAVFQSISMTFKAINSLFGIEVLLLLLAVILFSSGLSAVGVPKGKLAFFSALAAADFFWLVWLIAQKSGSYLFIFKVLKTNLILLSPYLLVLTVKTIWPVILHHVRRRLYSKRGMKKEQLMKFSTEIMQLNVYLSKYIQQDLITDEEYVVLSNNTYNSLRHLLSKLNSLKKYQNSELPSNPIKDDIDK
ncbi:MAG: hypothetical protein JW982_15930 [Spirochaetes bacterium]|nr:hypothetical protein [Spirochaetota bacterium]